MLTVGEETLQQLAKQHGVEVRDVCSATSADFVNLLTLRGGRTLDRSQIAGIVHLVSSSVPELNPKAVSVLDQSGSLLAGPPEGMAGVNGGGANGMDPQQLQYVNQIESGYAKRILELVEPIGVIPYSADEPNEAMFALGFTNYWDTYFAGRAAPLGEPRHAALEGVAVQVWHGRE